MVHTSQDAGCTTPPRLPVHIQRQVCRQLRVRLAALLVGARAGEAGGGALGGQQLRVQRRQQHRRSRRVRARREDLRVCVLGEGVMGVGVGVGGSWC
jgi:hypothetical protein